MDLQELSRLARAHLGCELRFAEAREPLDPALLSPGERTRLETFSLPRRREEWLRGRAALKALLRDLGLPDDTAMLAFPDPRVSLTHSAGLAFAAGRTAADQAASARPEAAAATVLAASEPGPAVSPTLPGLPAGIGVDYEARRPMQARLARFFLAKSERVRLEENPGQDDLLRLWTVKEALFKANPGNSDGDGRFLTSYLIESPLQAMAGTARGPAPGNLGFRFFSVAAGDGYLTAAVAMRSGSIPAK